MTSNLIDPASISVPAAKRTPEPAVANFYVRQHNTSAADIVVPAFAPAPAEPKAKAVSAKTSSGEWPSSAETRAAIEADIDELGPDAGQHEKAFILIAACIGRGIDAGTHIYSLGVKLGFNSLLKKHPHGFNPGLRRVWRHLDCWRGSFLLGLVRFPCWVFDFWIRHGSVWGCGSDCRR